MNKAECKVQIGYGITPLSGHINVDPLGGEDKTQGSILDLDSVVEDSECTKIVGEMVLDYVHISELDSAIKGWIKKLRHGGRIVLGGTDIVELSKRIIRKEYNESEINLVLHGHGDGVFVKGSYNLEFINKAFLNLGLKIKKKTINGESFIIEGERP